jgi:hypothetical protein
MKKEFSEPARMLLTPVPHPNRIGALVARRPGHQPLAP